MHQIAKHMTDVEAWFSPFFAGPFWDFCRKANLVEWTIAGNKLRSRCSSYLRDHDLRVDDGGVTHQYDLVLICTDVVMAKRPRQSRMVLVQEGILDPPNAWLPWIQRFPHLVPRWTNGTAATGLSLSYERFCVASPGYLEYFESIGVPRERMVVTGIPNFDDCRRYLENDFPHRGYVLVCTSDARETFKKDDRATLIRYALEIAGDRQVIFKLHPNEKVERARAEVHALAPSALVFSDGCAEHMIANCSAFVGQYSSTAFVALALGKEVHSYFEKDELRRLMPEQNGVAAHKIAEVCHEVLSEAIQHAQEPKRDQKRVSWFPATRVSS